MPVSLIWVPGDSCTHTVCVSCRAGGADILADPDDTVILLRQLPKLFAHHHEPKYGHLDFIWGYNTVHRVYWRVLEVLASIP